MRKRFFSVFIFCVFNFIFARDIPQIKAFVIPQQGEVENMKIDVSVKPISEELFEVNTKLVNQSGKRVKCKLVIEAQTDFIPTRYLIPCVMYNGNEYGSVGSPKGLTYKGKPWIFSYDRSGIPACSITENQKKVFSIFASEKNENSLRCSSSLIKNQNGHFLHRIYYPVTEAPVTYSAKNKFSAPYEEWLDLDLNEEFSVYCYVVSAESKIENYGFIKVFDNAWNIFRHDVPPSLSNEEVWNYGIAFISSLKVVEEDGKEWFCGAHADANHAVANNIKREGLDPNLTLADMEKNPELNFYFKPKKSAGIGFSCQGFMCARVMIADSIADKTKLDQMNFALKVLDNWIDNQLENGLILKSHQKTTDCCHMGWGIIEMARISQLLNKNGLDSSRHLKCAEKLADFFVKNYDPNYAFGKVWNRDGKALDKSGSVGGFVLLGLVELWKINKNPKLLDTINRSMDFYFSRDLDNFVCTAGAIDCRCVDKESAYPFFESAIELYAATGEKKYLNRAIKAAYYICSWLFCYDALYPENSEFSQIKYHTAGGTAISAEHHAIDAYAALMVNDFLKLSKFTGDPKWKDIGKLIWNNSIQAIATPQNRIWHKIERPIGAQNEGFFQTRWTKYRTDCNNRGHLNDYLGVWLSAFRLSNILAEREFLDK